MYELQQSSSLVPTMLTFVLLSNHVRFCWGKIIINIINYHTSPHNTNLITMHSTNRTCIHANDTHAAHTTFVQTSSHSTRHTSVDEEMIRVTCIVVIGNPFHELLFQRISRLYLCVYIYIYNIPIR